MRCDRFPLRGHGVRIGAPADTPTLAARAAPPANPPAAAQPAFLLVPQVVSVHEPPFLFSFASVLRGMNWEVQILLC